MVRGKSFLTGTVNDERYRDTSQKIEVKTANSTVLVTTTVS